MVLERLYGDRSGARSKQSHRSLKQRRPSDMTRLQEMITYKCRECGIPVVLVRPDFTSQRCPRCGTIDKNNRRTRRSFGASTADTSTMPISLHPLISGSWLSEVGLPSASLMRSLVERTASPIHEQDGVESGAADRIQDAETKKTFWPWWEWIKTVVGGGMGDYTR